VERWHFAPGVRAMPYLTIRKAISERQSLTAIYENYIRHFSPITLGKDTGGTQTLLAYQYGGGRPGGLSISGAWCCFQVGALHRLRLNGDKWLGGPLAGGMLNCVVEIDVSVAAVRIVQF
jgi:hypothetical protein